VRLRPSVRWFAGVMEQRLREFDTQRGKRGWRDDPPQALFGRLVEEGLELQKAVDRLIEGDSIIREAADVANFAMMIADRIVV